jgi:hypothetical protein
VVLVDRISPNSEYDERNDEEEECRNADADKWFLPVVSQYWRRILYYRGLPVRAWSAGGVWWWGVWRGCFAVVERKLGNVRILFLNKWVNRILTIGSALVAPASGDGVKMLLLASIFKWVQFRCLFRLFTKYRKWIIILEKFLKLFTKSLQRNECQIFFVVAKLCKGGGEGGNKKLQMIP